MQRLLVGWLVLSMSLSAAAQETSTADAATQAPAADTSAPELDQAARLLFEAGSRAYAAGRFGEALMRYQNAYQLSQRPALLYNIAVCNDRLDRKQEAVDAYAMFLDALPNSRGAPIARARLEILRVSLAREAARDTRTHDGDDAPDGNGGEHAADASADSTDETPAPMLQQPRSSGSLAGPLIAFGVAGAGLITFVVAGLITRGRYGDCQDGNCSAAEFDAVDRSALIADVGLGVTLAGAALGAILLLVGGGRDDDEHAQLTPTLGPDSAGLMLRGSF